MALRIDWTQHDGLTARERYEAAGAIIDEAKAAAAVRRAGIAAELLASAGAPAAAAELGISATRVYQLAARHKAASATTSTSYLTWAGANDGSSRRYEAYIREVIEAGGADPGAYDITAIGDGYKTAIQAELPAGVEFVREEFIGPHPAPEDAREMIRAAVARVDLWEIVARHDPDAVSA